MKGLILTLVLLGAVACGKSPTGPPPPPPPPSSEGTLEVTADKNDLNVLVNGVAKGVTPLTLTLTTGTYSVTLEQPNGYENVASQTATISKNATTRVNFQLERCRELLIGTHLNMVRGPAPSSTCGGIFRIMDPQTTVGIAVIDSMTIVRYASNLQISKDDGQTWNTIPNCPIIPGWQFFNKEVAIAIFPGKPLTGLLGVQGNFDMMYRFTENGCESLGGRFNFIPSNFALNGLGSIGVSAIVINPNNPSEIWASGEATIWHSTDGGQTFEVQFRNLNMRIWDITYMQGILYAAGREYNSTAVFLKSSDRGVTWVRFTNGLPRSDLRTIEIDPKNINHIYGGVGLDILESTNGGNNWNIIFPNNGPMDLVIDREFILTPHHFSRIGENSWKLFSTDYFGEGFVVKLKQ